MSDQGETQYQINDSLPASDVVLWSSQKWSNTAFKFFFTSPLVNNVLTALSSPNKIVFPSDAFILICARGITAASTNVVYFLNTTPPGGVSIGVGSKTSSSTSLYSYVNVKAGDTMTFTSTQPSLFIDIYEL